MNCTSAYKTHINGTRTHRYCALYIDSCTYILYYCTQLAWMDYTSMYTTVQCTVYTTVQWTLLYSWKLCTHYAWISCTAVRLYCSPVSVHLYCKLVVTNKSPSKITYMNHVNTSVLFLYSFKPWVEYQFVMPGMCHYILIKLLLPGQQ